MKEQSNNSGTYVCLIPTRKALISELKEESKTADSRVQVTKSAGERLNLANIIYILNTSTECVVLILSEPHIVL